MRKLASVEVIDEVVPIEGADQIESAKVRGWNVVVGKDQFQPGDRCLYFEIDSILPVTMPQFADLAVRGVRTDAEGNSGHVLKTIKLRGTYSQGLVKQLADFPELADKPVGADVTAELGIVLWAPPVPASISGLALGPIPSWISKTDEERIQNMLWVLDSPLPNPVATEKVDGTSMTVYLNAAGRFGVCGRNWEYAEANDNPLWKLAEYNKLKERIAETWPNWALDLSVPELGLSYPKS